MYKFTTCPDIILISARNDVLELNFRVCLTFMEHSTDIRNNNLRLLIYSCTKIYIYSNTIKESSAIQTLNLSFSLLYNQEFLKAKRRNVSVIKNNTRKKNTYFHSLIKLNILILLCPIGAIFNSFIFHWHLD